MTCSHILVDREDNEVGHLIDVTVLMIDVNMTIIWSAIMHLIGEGLGSDHDGSKYAIVICPVTLKKGN